MRYRQSEKMEIIRLVEESDLPVKRALGELDVPKSTFYRWYRQYAESGYDGLASQPPHANRFWNRIPEKAGIAFRFTLPHKGFHRRIGLFGEHHVSPDGKILSEAEWTRQHGAWLPTEEDRAYVCSLMGRVTEHGKFANWIAPPARGINNQPADFEYVRFN